MLHLKEVSFCYSEQEPVISSLTLAVSAGEAVGIRGASGSGKSSLLRLIAGELSADSGGILVEGESPKVVLLHQELNLWPHLTTAENISVVRRYHPEGLSEKESYELAQRLGLSPFMKRFPRELSGGQRQRAALIRAMVCRPDLLLLDKPTSALDGTTTEIILQELQRAKGEGMGFLIASHDPVFLEVFCDRNYHLEGGRLRKDIPLVDLIEKQKSHQEKINSLPTAESRHENSIRSERR